MSSIFAVIIILVLSFFIVRVAAIALVMTGMSDDAARFQARSAYTGTGFTTGEAEQVMVHPVRRRIIMILMVVRSAGLITAVVSLLLSFLDVRSTKEGLSRIGALLVACALLWGISLSRWFNRGLNRLIERLIRKSTGLELIDFFGVLHLEEDYVISEIALKDEHWMCHSPLRNLNLAREGLLILGIKRSTGEYIGAPTGDTTVYPKDLITLYGLKEKVSAFKERPKGFIGEIAHQEGVVSCEETIAKEKSVDPLDS